MRYNKSKYKKKETNIIFKFLYLIILFLFFLYYLIYYPFKLNDQQYLDNTNKYTNCLISNSYPDIKIADINSICDDEDLSEEQVENDSSNKINWLDVWDIIKHYNKYITI